MNIFKATIATAAFTVCCFGNLPANAGIVDRIATNMCRESHSSLRRAHNNKTYMRTLVSSKTQQAMKSYSDVMIPMREMAQYEDSEAIGWALYRGMKSECSVKAKTLFGVN